MGLLRGPLLTPGNKCAKWVTFNLETEEQDDVSVFWQIQNETHSYFKEIEWGPEYPSICTSIPLGVGYFYSFEEMTFKSCSMWTDHQRRPQTCIILIGTHWGLCKVLGRYKGTFNWMGHFPLESRWTAVLRKLKDSPRQQQQNTFCVSHWF